MVLIAFFLLEYLYILSYHLFYLASFIMSEILTNTHSKSSFPIIEEKIMRYNNHKEFIQIFNVNQKHLKALVLSFNHYLSYDSPNLQKMWRCILRNTSFQLRNNVIQSITFQSFYKNTIYQKKISRKSDLLLFTILRRQQSKYQTNNITSPTIHEKF